jgi:hypothetical protein
VKKPTPAALVLFDAVLPTDARVERKKMFGMPGAFVNGNLFLGVFADGVTLRLDDARLTALREHPGVGPFEPKPGSPWRAYVHIASDVPVEQVAAWATEALTFTATMPAKAPRKKKG